METTLQPVKTIPLQRLGGAAFMLGSLLFMVNKLDEMSRLFLGRAMPDVISGENLLLILVGQVALITGFAIYYRTYAERASRAGKNALRLFCGGGILLAIGHISFMTSLAEVLPPVVAATLEAIFVFVLLGVALTCLGLVWFGVLNLRQPVIGRWRWLPVATGLMGAIGFFLFSGEQINATFLFFRTLFALGLIGLGLILWLERPLQAEMA
jgi:hypothetical protein